MLLTLKNHPNKENFLASSKNVSFKSLKSIFSIELDMRVSPAKCCLIEC